MGILLPEIDQAGGLTSNSARCVMLDKHDLLWVGTDNGLSIFNATSEAQRNITKTVGDRSIWSINFLDSLVFIGSRFDGLYIFDQYSGKLVHHYSANIIPLIRKIKVFENQLLILSNKGIFEWRSGELIQLNFTVNINDDFPTDAFYWHGNLYALAYPTRNVIKYSKNAFEENCTSAFIPETKHNSLLCAATKGDRLVIGGDRFYVIVEDNVTPQSFPLTQSLKENYVVNDISFVDDFIILALGENNASRNGMLYVHGTAFEGIQDDAYGFITSMALDSTHDRLFYATLNKGLFLQKAIGSIVNINNSKNSKIIANDDYTFLFTEKSISRILNRNEKLSNSVLFFETENGNPLATHISGDTLIIAFKRHIKLYDANTLKLIKTINRDDVGIGLVDMQLIGNNLYIFFNYLNSVFQINLLTNATLAINIESFLPSVQKDGDKIILLNKEKGFNVIEKNAAYTLKCPDKSIAFSEDFTLLNGYLFTLLKNGIKSFRLDYISHQLVPVKNFDIDHSIERFTAKWIFSKNNKLYLANEAGILQIEKDNGLPNNYYYFGNYDQIEKPIIAGNNLIITTSSMLTKIAFDVIDQKAASINTENVNLQYPETVNENLIFSIDLSYPDYLTQNHILKEIEIKKNNLLVSRKYSIDDQFHLANGLKYGNYDLIFRMGNAQLDKQISISLPLNRNPLFFAAIILFVLILLILLIKGYLNKKEFNKKLMENRLQVLKQNLNPHFVFNSMNLISSLILEEKYDKAVEVVSEFSNLQRTYLETNNKDSITLTEELKFLRSYLKLQQTRFHHDKEFDFSILVSPEIDCNAIMLPPLILQPLAENSIKYGIISSKAIYRKIWVEVTGKNPTIIGIEDNGQDISTSHKGLGLGHQLVKERIELFRIEYKTAISIDFLTPPKFSKTGYRVEIHIG